MQRIGETLILLNREEEALQYLLKALEINKEKRASRVEDAPSNLQKKMASNHDFVGETFLRTKKYQEALVHFKNALEISKQIPGKLDNVTIKVKIAEYYKSLGYSKVPLDDTKEAPAFATKSTSKQEQCSIQ